MLQVMPDDHSKLVPPLPIPNRTVKRLRADDSASTRVKVGHRQASYMKNPLEHAPGGFCFGSHLPPLLTNPKFGDYPVESPSLLDEPGYLPINKFGADALFQIISHRYECGPVIVTSSRVFKNWLEIFNNDSTLTSVLLDRLLHHAETVVIEGKSCRMKDQSKPE